MTPLRQRMIETLELRGFSPKTVKLYVDCVARFARHFGKSPEQLGAEEVRTYLLYLVHERKVAWATYKQALSALRFLYRWVLERGEVVQDIRAPAPNVACRSYSVSRKFTAFLRPSRRLSTAPCSCSPMRPDCGCPRPPVCASQTLTANGW